MRQSTDVSHVDLLIWEAAREHITASRLTLPRSSPGLDRTEMYTYERESSEREEQQLANVFQQSCSTLVSPNSGRLWFFEVLHRKQLLGNDSPFTKEFSSVVIEHECFCVIVPPRPSCGRIPDNAFSSNATLLWWDAITSHSRPAHSSSETSWLCEQLAYRSLPSQRGLCESLLDRIVDASRP